jgi:FAD synthase
VRLRGDQIFASVDELSQQIACDVEQARSSLRRFSQGVR